MHLKFYVLSALVWCFLWTGGLEAQNNKKIELLHFEIPADVVAGSDLVVGGYIKNVGNGSIPNGLKMKYRIKAPTGNNGNRGNNRDSDWTMTDFESYELPHLHSGDSVYVERTFQATQDIITPGKSNIVILWPTLNAVDDRSMEIEESVYVHDGTGGTTNARVGNDVTKVRIMIPESKNIYAKVMECYDRYGTLVASQNIEDTTKNSHVFNLTGLTERESYTIIVKDSMGDILQKIPIKKR